MTESWADGLRGLIGENRWARERLAGLTDDELDLYTRILQCLAAGKPPPPAQLESSASGLGRLVTRDLIQLDAAGDVAVAYPFSARPTRHRVRLADGRRYWANCAIDALGVPYMLRAPGVVEAREPDGEQAITVAVEPDTGTLRCDPPGATVVVAASGNGCVAACACPHINAFGSRGAAERYLAASGLRGTILDVPAAAAAGRALFGDLNDLLTAQPGRRVPDTARAGPRGG
ncbi:MAG TPA: organomercurial lyase [Solirubrobacteraceae bacterium]|nr:organomercurial lyase [Solirubrobacteraceae bacterium]